MSRLWDWIDSKNISNDMKTSIFLLLNCLKYSILGFLAWLIVSRFALSTLDWALCFTGYPGILIGFIGGYIFLSRK